MIEGLEFISFKLEEIRGFVVDLPNLIFTNRKFDDKKARATLSLFLELINEGIPLILVVSFKVLKLSWFNTLERFRDKKKKNVHIIVDKGDVDTSVLYNAVLNNYVVLSNDKFREKKYSIFKKLNIKQIFFRYELSSQDELRLKLR